MSGFARVDTPELSLEVPADWEDCSVVRYVFPEIRASLRLATVPSPAQGTRYHAFAHYRRMQKNAPGFRRISFDFFRIGGESAFELVFDWTNDGVPCRNFVRLLVREGVLSILTATTPVETLEEIEPTIRRALASLALA